MADRILLAGLLGQADCRAGGGSRVVRRDSTGVCYLLGDHLGSTSVAATASGVLTGTLLYGPWGATRYSSGVTPTSYRYTGQCVVIGCKSP